MALARDELVARMVRAGELEVLGGDQAEIESYSDTSKFRFHGPKVSRRTTRGLPTTSSPYERPSTFAQFARNSRRRR
jgi:hypothetical protein